MEYLAKLNNALSFELSQDNKHIGELTYQSWFKFNASLVLDKQLHYKIEPKGFWETTIELKNTEDLLLLNFKMNWNGEIVIQTFFGGIEKGYVFEKRGLFKESFVLMDQDRTELLVMKPDLKWSKMNYEYQLTTTNGFENSLTKKILLLTSIHCANYYISMMVGEY